LFDALCLEQQHFNNTQLAATYCAEAGNTTQSGYASALKNLANWRSGKHVPRRNHFEILSTILKIDDRDGLRPVWEGLFAGSGTFAQSSEFADQAPDLPADAVAVIEPMPAVRRRPVLNLRRSLSLGVIVLAAIAVSYFMVARDWWATVRNGPQLVVVHSIVKLKLGQSVALHGARADDCSGPPPEWRDVQPALPAVTLGTLSDGGVGVRFSNTCNGITPIRIVRFTATALGHEQIVLYSNPISIDVK
jgi:hypothetical protein